MTERRTHSEELAAGDTLEDSRWASGDKLTPPNDRPHIVLPDSNVSVHRRPMTHASVIKVYPTALSFVDHISAMRGYLGVGGIGGAIFALLGLADNLGGDAMAAFLVVDVLLLLIAAICLQGEFVGFRYQPVLVDQRLGQVHVFASHMLPWWQWFWKLWGRSGWEVQSYDWRCIRAEVIQFTIFSGQIPRRESALIFAVTDSPGSSNVIQRFAVGPTSAYGDIESMLQRWEHIRRFMRKEGPAWVPGDTPFEDFGVTFWDGATFLQPLLNPMFAELRRSGRHAWIWPLGVVALIGLPLTAPIGLVRWLSYRLNAEPVWPKDIQASLGRPLRDDELAQPLKLTGSVAPGRPGRAGQG